MDQQLIDQINDSGWGGWIALAGLIMVAVCIYFFVVYTPKCKKHGVELSEEWQIEEGMGPYDGTASRAQYCHLCRAEEAKVAYSSN